MTEQRMQEDRFHHEALFYADAEELLAGAVPFLRAGLEAEEAILVAMPSSRLELLKGELGTEGERILFSDMGQLGRNPARIIPAWRDFLDANLSSERGVRGIGEPIWSGRSAAELDECARHESLLNLVFDEGPGWSLVCPYDTAALSDEVLSSAERNHPVLSHGGGLSASGSYADPRADGGPFQGELDVPATAPAEFPFTIEELGQLRRFVSEHAGREGLGPSRVEDLVLAAHELATNSIQHGGGKGSVRMWRENGSLICDVRDRGRIDQHLIGRLPPAPDQIGGRGVWLANQLCDLVQIRSGELGSVVRLKMAVDAPPL